MLTFRQDISPAPSSLDEASRTKERKPIDSSLPVSSLHWHQSSKVHRVSSWGGFRWDDRESIKPFIASSYLELLVRKNLISSLRLLLPSYFCYQLNWYSLFLKCAFTFTATCLHKAWRNPLQIEIRNNNIMWCDLFRNWSVLHPVSYCRNVTDSCV